MLISLCTPVTESSIWTAGVSPDGLWNLTILSVRVVPHVQTISILEAVLIYELRFRTVTTGRILL